MIELENANLRLAVLPELGASVSRCEWFDGATWRPILHAPVPNAESGIAFDSALFPMVPFPNRARSNILAADGLSYRVAPNTKEPFAIHGTGWERRWRVLAEAPDQTRLGLSVSGDYAFDFECEYRIAIDDLSISLEMGVRNFGSEPIPVGLGFHPYFPRLPDTNLQFHADAFYPQGPDRLPMDPVQIPRASSYDDPSPLPDTGRDNAFGGWDGIARIGQPSLGYELAMSASPRSRELMFYAPTGQEFFALEPQSALSGATTAGPAEQKGLEVLRPDCSFHVDAELRVIPLP